MISLSEEQQISEGSDISSSDRYLFYSRGGFI